MTKRSARPQAGKPVAQAAPLELGIELIAARPNLYIGIVGTLVLQEGTSFRLAPFAREFIREIRNRFHLIFLSKLSTAAAKEVSELLEAEFEIGSYRKGLGKVSGIDFSRPFLWIDQAPSSRDLMRLAEERCSSHLITVNGRDGVTRGTLTKVEFCLDDLMIQR
ncbi:MAG: hypothetical protein KDB53_01145 [Planctomycetes bacterium]|nr:hypothetical protein [Planctomycetota bacterium]